MGGRSRRRARPSGLTDLDADVLRALDRSQPRGDDAIGAAVNSASMGARGALRRLRLKGLAQLVGAPGAADTGWIRTPEGEAALERDAAMTLPAA